MINFSQVKQIIAPFGEIIKIQNVIGDVLWSKLIKRLFEWRGLSPLACTPTVAGDFEDTRIYGNSKQGKLPDGYTQLEYIQNDANSYIKTGINAGSEDLSYEVDFTYVSGSGYQYVLGVYGGDGVRNTVLYINLTNEIGGWINKPYNENVMTPDIVVPNQRIKCYTDTTKFVVDGITKTEFTISTATITKAELYIFRRNGNGAGASPQTTSNAILRLHSLIIKDKGVELRNYIPAKRNSDNVVGLYDLVSNTFFTNAGTGSFTAGATLPTPQAPLEIESVGDRTVNLFDKSLEPFNAYINVSQGLWIYSDDSLSYRIPCKANTQYTVSCNEDSIIVRVATTSSEDIVTSGNSISVDTKFNTSFPNELTFTTGNTDKYIIIQINQSSIPIAINNLQLEQGSQVTPYEPYVEPTTTNIYLDEPLRQIGSYSDYIDFKEKKVVRNIRSDKLGTDGWTYDSQYTRFYKYFNAFKSFGTRLTPILSECFIKCDDGRSIADVKNNSVYSGSINDLHNVYFKTDVYNTVEDFTNALKDTSIVYPLITPTEETIDLPQIQALDNTSIITVDTTIPPSEVYASQYVEE